MTSVFVLMNKAGGLHGVFRDEVDLLYKAIDLDNQAKVTPDRDHWIITEMEIQEPKKLGGCGCAHKA